LRISEELAIYMYSDTVRVLIISAYERIILWYYAFAQIWSPRYQKL